MLMPVELASEQPRAFTRNSNQSMDTVMSTNIAYDVRECRALTSSSTISKTIQWAKGGVRWGLVEQVEG
jgi:hypothetical protein